jgi:hypothetical protein
VKAKHAIHTNSMRGYRMERRDWTLLVIAAAGGEALSPVQLQKAVFIIGQELAVGKNFYKFRAYDYGPFDAMVYSDAEELGKSDLITITFSERGYRLYSVTPKGLIAARKLLKTLPGYASDYVTRIVTWVRSTSFEDLIKAVYKKYPKYAVNSVFKG